MQSQVPANHAAGRREPETKAETYLRQIRNMLAWMIILWVLAIAGGITAGIVLGHDSNSSSSGSGLSTTSPCQANGGVTVGC